MSQQKKPGGGAHRPKMEFHAGAIVVAVWLRDIGSDRSACRYEVRIQKRFHDDKTGKWRTTSLLRPDELPRLVLAASKAYEFIMLRETGSLSGSSPMFL